MAKLELEWWIIHRQRESHARGDLDASLAALAGAIYRRDIERFREHARYRAEAMIFRDKLSEQGSVRDADWQQINRLFAQSWTSLKAALE